MNGDIAKSVESFEVDTAKKAVSVGMATFKKLEEKLVDDSMFDPAAFADNPDSDVVQEQEHNLKKNKRFIRCIVIVTVMIIITSVSAILGYTLKSDSEQQQTTDSSQKCTYHHPQYPYLGGGACSKACYSENYASPPLNLKLSQDPSSFSSQFQSDYESAGMLLASTGLDIGKGGEHIIDYDPAGMHMTLDYFCCYSPIEIQAIDEIAKSFKWPPVEVSIDRLICTKNDYTDSAELMVLLDADSQQKLLPIVKQFEEEMAAQGLFVNVPRSENIGFHITLAHVNQSVFEVNRMVDEINRNIKWSQNTMTMFNNSHVCPGPDSAATETWMQSVECLG